MLLSSINPSRGILCGGFFFRARCHQYSLEATSFRCVEREGLDRLPQHSFALTAVAWLQRTYHHIQVAWHTHGRADSLGHPGILASPQMGLYMCRLS